MKDESKTTNLHYHTKDCNSHRGVQYPCDCDYPTKIKLQDKKHRTTDYQKLMKVREFLAQNYSLPIMEAHHDGHPIEPCAREAWDNLHEVIGQLQEPQQNG